MEVYTNRPPGARSSMRTPTRTGTPLSVTGDCLDCPAATSSLQSSPVEAVGTPPKQVTVAPNTVARHPTLRRQSLQEVARHLLEAAELVEAAEASKAPKAAKAPEARSETVNCNASRRMLRTRKRRHRTCCPESTRETPEATARVQAEVATTIATAVNRNEAISPHASLGVHLQFDIIFTRLTEAVNRLADVSTTRASKLCVMRETYRQRDTGSPLGHALNSDIEAELGIVTELSDMASNLMRIRHLWTRATDGRFAPYEAIAQTVDQLIREAHDASTNEAPRTSERHRRKNAPCKLTTEERHGNTEPRNDQTDEEYGDAATKLDDH